MVPSSNVGDDICGDRVDLKGILSGFPRFPISAKNLYVSTRSVPLIILWSENKVNHCGMLLDSELDIR